jgi:hypothetical protein
MPYQSTTSGAHTLHTFLQMFYTFNPATCSVSFAELQTFSFIHTWKVVCRYRSQSFRHALLHNTFATVANRWGCRCDSHYCIQIPGKSLTSYNRDSAQAKVLLIALSVRRKVHDLCSPVEDCLGSRASCDTKSIKSVHFLVPTTNKQKLRRVAPWPLTCCRSSFLKSVAVVSKS